MFHNDRDGKQGAFFACSHKSLLETEMQNSGEFSFRFLFDIIKIKKRRRNYSSLCVGLEKIINFFGGESSEKIVPNLYEWGSKYHTLPPALQQMNFQQHKSSNYLIFLKYWKLIVLDFTANLHQKLYLCIGKKKSPNIVGELQFYKLFL